MTVFLRTLWCSMKQVKARYVFDGKHGIALHEMQGNRASSRGKGEVSWFFLNCGMNLGYILRLRRGWPFKTSVFQRRQDSCLVRRDTSGISSRLERAIRALLEVRRETQGHFPVATVILGFLSIFKRSQASSSFEASKSACLLRC